MGGDHGGHGHGIKIPDYRIYKVEDAPPLAKVRDALARRGLKDPWLRNHVWRFNKEIHEPGKTPFRKALNMFGPGFKVGFGLFLASVLVGSGLKPSKPDECDEDEQPKDSKSDGKPPKRAVGTKVDPVLVAPKSTALNKTDDTTSVRDLTYDPLNAEIFTKESNEKYSTSKYTVEDGQIDILTVETEKKISEKQPDTESGTTYAETREILQQLDGNEVSDNVPGTTANATGATDNVPGVNSTDEKSSNKREYRK